MARIKIKSRQNGKEQKLKLLEILCRKDIEMCRIITTHDGFVVLTINENSADCIFKKETKLDLSSHDFLPVLPPELRAKKSVIIPRVDDVVYEKNTVDIGEELIRHNSWIGEDDLEDVYKFPNSPTLKLTFTQTTLAKKCTEQGLKAFKISIPCHEIKLETYIPIKCCMKCYALEDHFSNECPKSKDFKVCSECSREGHVWHQCTATNKQCLNCSGSHSTLAMKCVKRKEIIKEKRTQDNERQKMTYSNIIQSTTLPKLPTYNLPQISKEELLKINICVAHAQIKNQEKPGSYTNELNKVLKANNLPDIIIPDEAEDNTEQMDDGANGLNTTENLEPIIQKIRISRHSSTGNLSVSQVATPAKKLEACELGLQFYTTKSKGWPSNFSTEDLINDIRSNKVKWKYTNNKYTEEQILRKTQKR